MLNAIPAFVKEFLGLTYLGKLENFLESCISIELKKLIVIMNDGLVKETDINKLTEKLKEKTIFSENFNESPILILSGILKLLSRECNPNTNWIENMFMIMPAGIEGCQGCFIGKSFFLSVNGTEPTKVKLESLISSRNLCANCNQNEIIFPQTLIVEVLNPAILAHSLDFNIQSKTYELVAVGFDNHIRFKNVNTTHWFKYDDHFAKINLTNNLFEDKRAYILVYVCADNIESKHKPFKINYIFKAKELVSL